MSEGSPRKCVGIFPISMTHHFGMLNCSLCRRMKRMCIMQSVLRGCRWYIKSLSSRLSLKAMRHLNEKNVIGTVENYIRSSYI